MQPDKMKALLSQLQQKLGDADAEARAATLVDQFAQLLKQQQELQLILKITVQGLSDLKQQQQFLLIQ